MIDDLSLVHGWVPVAAQVSAGVYALIAVARRGVRWWTLWMPLAVVVGVAVGFAGHAYAESEGMTGAPLPVLLWVLFGLAAASFVVVAVGWRHGRRWQQAMAVVATVVSLLAAGTVLNQWTGYMPTVRQAWDLLTGQPLPGEVPLAALDGMRGGPPRHTGALVHVHAPTPASGFVHRDEVVYLPPAWFAGPRPPELPVVVLVGGAFNTPEDWVRIGAAHEVADDYAARHDGVAPVLVMADVSGSIGSDTECVDGPRARAATYTVQDLAAYVQDTFGTARDPRHWGIAGWSMGGTCALSLTAAHPERFGTFLDIAGDATPNAGSPEDTLERLYDGDTALRDRYDPVTALRAHGRYDDVAGVFVDGNRSGSAGDDAPPPDPSTEPSTAICAEARTHGVSCEVITTGRAHRWSFAEWAFRERFDWLAGRVG